ncbi:MAG: MATE family efflux transporter [Bacteroidales bacterium]|jgi:MATE family multidrug resistance protein|nr:MATE family efflux transporter [Bacteroidales bacterium]MDD3300547.1 MATE family efflux transporter [Bacteroidales bacterium]MDD3844142.1 MATE family efflux transporter [Bacteroidales bacterium]MDD4618611.1 MATE family efflux transporter [Bacteroidales bacterium]
MNLKEYMPYYRKNLTMAIPVMLTQAGQVTVQLADNIMVGHLGTAQLASVSFANSIFILGMVFGIGFTQGLTPHVGQSFGKDEHQNVSALLKNSMVLNTLAAIFLTAIMAFASSFMKNMGQTQQVVEYGREYYSILLFSLLPFLLFFGMRQFSEGIGITKYAMYITLFANFTNVALNWILIFGKFGVEPMGIKGAAMATLISRIIMLVLFVFLFLKLNCYKKYISNFKAPLINKKLMIQVLKTSIPLSFQNVVEITAFSLSAIMVGWLGEVALASHQVAMSMSSFSFMLALGVGAAATIRVSHQYGFGDYKSMRVAGFASIHLSVMLMSVCGIGYILFRHQIPAIYTQDPLVREMAAGLLIISALFQIFDAIQLSSLACLRALADVKIPLVQSIISYYLICLPLGYLFGFVFNLGATGVWIGLLTGLAFAATLFLYRFNIISNRLIKTKQTSETGA